MSSTKKTGKGASDTDVSRRNFLKGGSIASLMALMGGVEIKAKTPPKRAPAFIDPKRQETVKVGIIGYGVWGREIASTLGRNPLAEIAGVSDNFDLMLRRAERELPEAERYPEYQQLLDNNEIQAVIIATPTHLHREIAVAALDAGKHVYCEAPLAATVEDAKAIALAAKNASDQVFQSGLLFRSNPQHREVFQFIRSGAVGQPTFARSQWHNKQSWRRTSASREREQEINWRLDDDVSIGLMGEIGIHQLDMVNWYLQSRPAAINGYGQLLLWKDGREVPDTVQALVEYPAGVNMMYHANLTTSFDSRYDMFHGSESTILLRDSKAWMFKEVDAPMLGWEVYARKDVFYQEIGIALVANATQLDAQGLDPAEDDPNVETPLYYALETFLDNNVYGPFPAPAGVQESFNATVVAIKANEAVKNNTRVELNDDLFALAQ